MGNEEHLAILKQGVDVWNQWRHENPNIRPDLTNHEIPQIRLNLANLSYADLSGAYFEEADLDGANFWGSILRNCHLNQASLCEANFRDADLTEALLLDAKLYKADLSSAICIGTKFFSADLFQANLTNADLRGASFGNAVLVAANFRKAKLNDAQLFMVNATNADFGEANLQGATLWRAILIDTNFENANLTSCRVFGVSVWNTRLAGAIQANLDITQPDESTITVDNLKVAQFIYLLLNNAEIRDVIDTITGKAALILGRFTPERKVVLDALRDALRMQGYLPILFDFEKPASRDLTETILTLASLSRFVIADLTNPSSLPHELMSFVEKLPSVAVQPIILKEHSNYAMFEHLQRYQCVLPVHEYESQDSLLSELSEKVIQAAEKKVSELRPKSGKSFE